MALPIVTIAMDPRRWDEMLAPADLDRLRQLADVRLVEFGAPSTIEAAPALDPAEEERLADAARSSSALVVAHGSPCVTEAVLASADLLGFVGELEGDRFGGRIDVEAASRRGISVVDTTHGSSGPVAEFALALAILGLRDTWRYARRLQAGNAVQPTARTEPDRLVNNELNACTVGLVGFGNIGWRLVELLRPFGCPVLAYDPFAPRQLAPAMGVSFARSLETVFSACDVVVSLVPLTPATTRLIRGDLLRRMRPGAVFVNVSRGGVVDTDEMVAVATEDRHVFCLDVLEPEPIPVGHPLRALPNVFLTPHLAGATGQSRRRFFQFMVDELVRHFSGLEPHAQLTADVLAGRGVRTSAAVPSSSTTQEE
ncbi:NAD(P)-dependent oxidoreductase [Jiangella asiatica]|uniref:Hydroxyacid dehydrogenase n=1 Tax=Jiangella asiatica TaxID=2530372 RepID=A0A4R5D9Y9_9ACTN|nr:NAD(P)-dependent oxidoreductase [Jiangella asiatica]TDE08254.1 hypothetical protein E1269_18275 [Jiangella asiatica]